MCICGRCVFLCPFGGGHETFATMIVVFGTLERFRFIRACREITWEHRVLLSSVKFLASIWKPCNCRQIIFQPETGAETSGKEKAHKHKQIFPVTARVGGGGFPTGWPGVSRPVARGQKFMCCVRNPRNINIFVRVPGWEDSGTQPGGSVTGVAEKLFMCQMFMCLFRPLKPGRD